jgi:hypothetical protein
METLTRSALIVVGVVLLLPGIWALAYLVVFLTGDGTDALLLVGALPIWGGGLMFGALGVALLRLATRGGR